MQQSFPVFVHTDMNQNRDTMWGFIVQSVKSKERALYVYITTKGNLFIASSRRDGFIPSWRALVWSEYKWFQPEFEPGLLIAFSVLTFNCQATHTPLFTCNKVVKLTNFICLHAKALCTVYESVYVDPQTYHVSIFMLTDKHMAKYMFQISCLCFQHLFQFQKNIHNCERHFKSFHKFWWSNIFSLLPCYIFSLLSCYIFF